MIAAYFDRQGCVGDPRGLPMPQHIAACEAIGEVDELLTLIQQHINDLRTRSADYDLRLCVDDLAAEEIEDVRRLAAQLEPLQRAMEDIV